MRCADHVTPLYPQKLALTSPTGGGRSVGIVRSRTKATEFSLVIMKLRLLKLKNGMSHMSIIDYRGAVQTSLDVLDRHEAKKERWISAALWINRQ